MNIDRLLVSVFALGLVCTAAAHSQGPGMPSEISCASSCSRTNFFIKATGAQPIDTAFRIARPGGCLNYWYTAPGSDKLVTGSEVTYPKYQQNEGAACAMVCNFMRNAPNGAEFLAQCSIDDFSQQASGSHDCFDSTETVVAECIDAEGPPGGGGGIIGDP